MAVNQTNLQLQLSQAIQSLVDYATCCNLIDQSDRVWAYNATLDAIGVSGPGPRESWLCAQSPHPDDAFDLDQTLALLADCAVACGTSDDTASGRDRTSMRIMGKLMPKPSQMIAVFDDLRTHAEPKAATDWFYHLCENAGYVRRSAIARNIRWETRTTWGDLEITINLSKPEKDPREIAAAGHAPATGEKYPACQLCIENEGYSGRAASKAGGAHPARQNLRIIPVELGGERWGLQYSPYAYYNEHCIAMSAQHRPMHIDRKTLTCLLDFVDLFPHYFFGSNADLPVVGGSILSHDHFQGGAHVFPMMRAHVSDTFSIAGLSDVEGAVLKWPLSVMRLRSNSRHKLLEAAVRVIDAWRSWSDESAGIAAYDEDGTPHNTVTPIVRSLGKEGYEAYLALRCNVTSSEHPLGVFHPHAQWHHIKRENIGLIEVMGLAILPPRLVEELDGVSALLVRHASDHDALARALANDPLAASHADWALKIAKESTIDATNVKERVRNAVSEVFAHVLEDAGVFKWDEAGRAAQERFAKSL